MSTNPAQNCSDLASPRFEHPLARRTTALVTHAQALLASPPVFWQGLPDGPAERQKLSVLVQEVRSIEESVYLSLAMRVGLIIRQQRLDRACWDVLSNARELVRSRSGNEWSERWAELGFFDGSLKIPAAFESRLRALSCLMEYLTLHPDHENPAGHVTRSHCGDILRDFATVIEEGDRLRAKLEHSIGKLSSTVTTLKTALNDLHVSFYGTLRSRDPRWAGLFPMLLTSYANGDAPEAESSPIGLLKSIAGKAHPADRRCASGENQATLNVQSTPELPLENMHGASIASALAWLLPPS